MKKALQKVSIEENYLNIIKAIYNTDIDCKELTHWKRPWCWEKLRARREGDDRG